ncbi:MAG: 5,6-dimethylbenzimidazole synthase [bacterium]|nr:5,6-dimethylbenzimidazole synthase [bacterium]
MENSAQTESADPGFSDAERKALYRTIFTRRDVRGQFISDPIPEDVLSRVLMAAHYAPSVGFMQPWSFILIRAEETKRKVHKLFEKAHGEATEMFEGESREVYRNLKLEGILESPINICITCDRDRAGPVVIGRTHIKTMDVYSSVCAVQNLWLAARAEGLGLGWVSIRDQKSLKQALGIPKRIVPVAYVCLGYVSHFFDKPELQSAGWRPRLSLGELVSFEGYDKAADDPFAMSLLERVRKDQEKKDVQIKVFRALLETAKEVNRSISLKRA